jgi:hypothetical protein
MITVVTPATSRRLTTVTRAKAVLNFPASEHERVYTLIGHASDVIAGFCERQFALETVKETFLGGFSSGLFLSRLPVVTNWTRAVSCIA